MLKVRVSPRSSTVVTTAPKATSSGRLRRELHQDRRLEPPPEVAQVAVQVAELLGRDRVVAERDHLAAPRLELVDLRLELPRGPPASRSWGAR